MINYLSIGHNFGGVEGPPYLVHHICPVFSDNLQDEQKEHMELLTNFTVFLQQKMQQIKAQ